MGTEKRPSPARPLAARKLASSRPREIESPVARGLLRRRRLSGRVGAAARLRGSGTGWTRPSRDAADRADRIGAVLHEAGLSRRRVLRRDRQIDVADRSIRRIAPPLDDRLLQGAGQLPLKLNGRGLFPFPLL